MGRGGPGGQSWNAREMGLSRKSFHYNFVPGHGKDSARLGVVGRGRFGLIFIEQGSEQVVGELVGGLGSHFVKNGLVWFVFC